MFTLSGKHTATRTRLIIDIGSASIGAALVSFSNIEKPSICYNTRLPILFRENDTREQYLRSTLSALLSVLVAVRKEGIEALDSNYQLETTVSCFFSTLWSITKPVSFSVSRNEFFEVTTDLLERYTEREREKLRTSNAENNLEIVEECITSVKLNGYLTRNPFGKQVKQMDVALILSAIDREFLDKVEHAVGQFFSIDDLSYHSHPVASLNVIQHLSKENEHFALAHIGGGITTVGLVQDRRFIGLEHISKGTHFFMQSIANKLSISPEEAHDHLRAFQSNMGHPGISEQVREALDIAGREWAQELLTSLQKLSGNSALPRTMYLFDGGVNIAAWLNGIIAQELVVSDGARFKPARSVLFNSELLREYCAVKKGIVPDQGLMLESVSLGAQTGDACMTA